ncbi:hypothetical protein MPSEU_000685900 [Mayamaea pseudoterrestris]|nr:hypothetical protein MPSEU_000685900 [Mayamaea pseudoterrestris]
MRPTVTLVLTVAAICLAAVTAFSPMTPTTTSLKELVPSTSSQATSLTASKAVSAAPATATLTATAAALVTANMIPLAALAEEEYVYGAVDAPPLIPIIGGILAILTAALPIFLRSGEEAFEEMKDKDGFGSGRDQLKRK